jgi:hypothetical protein
MVGNGNLGFTADITGLQTFPEQLLPARPADDPGAVGMAQLSQPDRVLAPRKPSSPSTSAGSRGPTHTSATGTRRASRTSSGCARTRIGFSLGRLALHLAKADGSRAAFADLAETRQTLDLWTGRLESRFVFDGAPVEVRDQRPPDD